ncbi:MAG: YdbH domain-containing protein [Thermodesulfobacteriota bacterium]|nr:YdbH domain-containing protein [Thermodesulfobacteriota bacterium]
MIFNRKTLFYLLFVFFALLFFFMICCGFLPGFAEKKIREIITRTQGFDNFNIHINRIGLSGCDITGITTGKTLFIDWVHLDYSPESLLNRRIKTLLISGVHINAGIDDSGLILHDFQNTASSSSFSPPSSSSKENGLPLEKIEDRLGVLLNLPFMPEKIVVQNGILNLNVKGRKKPLPFEASFSVRKRQSRGRAEAFFSCTLDEPVTLASFHGNSVNTRFKAVHCFLESKYFDMNGNNSTQANNSPLIRAKGGFSMEIFENPESMHVNLEPVNIQFNFSADASTSGQWQAVLNWEKKADINTKHPICLSFFKGSEICLDTPFLEIKAKGADLKGDLEITAGCSGIAAIQSDTRVNFLSPEIKGHGRFDLNSQDSPGELKFNIVSSDFRIRSPFFEFKGPGIRVPGSVCVSSDFSHILKVFPAFYGASAEFEAYSAGIENMEFELPLTFPPKGETEKGRFSASKLTLKNENFGQITGTIQQIDGLFLVNGLADITGMFISPEKSVSFNFSSRADLLTADNPLKVALTFKTDKQRISSDVLKRKFYNSDMKFEFITSSQGRVDITNGRTTGRLTFDLSGGSVFLDQENLSIQGIDTQVQIRNIFALQSGPGQKLSVDQIDINDIHITDALVVYNIESDRSFLIESCRFKWCQGTVSTGSLRIDSQKDEYALDLYCDRLRLSEILKEIGAFQAEGQGSLNGKIPLSYNKGRLEFSNGFLYSTPGQGGTIRIMGTDILTSGIPGDSVQFSQLELAGEALKNYTYKWAKLNLNTIEDDLVVNMKFDGKPEKNLPFVYKKEVNRFVRVDEAHPGSHFQGIAIDVNLKLPLNRVLKFGTSLNQMLD